MSQQGVLPPGAPSLSTTNGSSAVAAGPIALVTLLPDATRTDTFDLLKSSDPGARPIVKEPQRGIVDFFATAAQVPVTLPRADERGSAPTYIVDVSKGGFARLEQKPGATMPDIQVSQGAFVQEFVEGRQFDPSSATPVTTSNSNSNATANNAGANGTSNLKKAWPWWSIALLITLAVLAIIASIIAIVFAVHAMNKEKADAERIEQDEKRLAQIQSANS
jgi:hypothetical protein